MNLDYMIPSEILDLVDDRQIYMQVGLEAKHCEGRWPSIEIWIDTQHVWSGQVQGTCTVACQGQAIADTCQIRLVYHGKTEQDTIVNTDGTMGQNQCFSIRSWIINGMDIVENQIIHSGIGHYTAQLSEQKYKYFLEHGHSVAPSTTLYVTENGTWQLDLGIPVCNFLLDRAHGETPAHQRFDLDEIIADVYATALECETLTQRGKKC